MDAAKHGEVEAGPGGPVPAGPIEKLCRLLSEASLLVMIVVIALDIVTRTLFNFSYEIADEIGGYMLVALAFFSLAVTQVNDGFHRVEFLQDMLPPKGQIVSRIIFDVVTLIFVGVLLWIFYGFVAASWRSGTVAPTMLMTPLWIAQLPMVLGLVAFALAIVRTIFVTARRLGELRSAR